MTLKTKLLLSIIIFAGFTTNDTHTSQDYRETSSVAKYCYNGKCFLSHSHNQTWGASCSLSGKHYDVNHDTPILIVDKEGNYSIGSGATFETNKELKNYFPTSCSLPKEFYITFIEHSENSYIAEEGNIRKDSSPVRYIKKHTNHPKKFYVLKEKNEAEEKYACADCKDFENLIVLYIAQQVK
jgi:hypothetical protein